MSQVDPPERRLPTPADVAARLSTVRREISLPNSALVVRGGTLRLEDLERAAETAEVRFKRPGLSVFAADLADPLALVEQVGAKLPHPVLSFSTMGRIRDKGLELEQTSTPPHHTVWLPEVQDREYWLRAFRSAFDRPVERSKLISYQVEAH